MFDPSGSKKYETITNFIESSRQQATASSEQRAANKHQPSAQRCKQKAKKKNRRKKQTSNTRGLGPPHCSLIGCSALAGWLAVLMFRFVCCLLVCCCCCCCCVFPVFFVSRHSTTLRLIYRITLPLPTNVHF